MWTEWRQSWRCWTHINHFFFFFAEIVMCTESIACLLMYKGVGYRRAGDIALPSFLVSMNSVSELVETILSRTYTADTNELALRSLRGGASLVDDPRSEKACIHPIVKRNWNIILGEADGCRLGLPLPSEWALMFVFSISGSIVGPPESSWGQ